MPHGPFTRVVASPWSKSVIRVGDINELQEALENTPTMEEAGDGLSEATADTLYAAKTATEAGLATSEAVNEMRVRGTGLVGDGTTDNRTAILALIAQAEEAASGEFYYSDNGSRVIELGSGVFAWSGLIDWANFVSPIGQGRTNTIFKALDANAQMRFGDNLNGAGAGTDRQAPRAGGFTIDGAHVGNDLMVCGFGSGNTYFDIHIQNAARDGLTLSACQNSTFDHIEIRDSGRDNLVHDMGAGGNVFINPHLGRAGRYFVRYDQTAEPPIGAALLYTEPRDNSIYDGLIEYVESTTDALIYHGAGEGNLIADAQIVGWDAVAPVSLVMMRKDYATSLSSNLVIRGGTVGGNATYGTGFDLGADTRVTIDGELKMVDLLRGFYVEDGASVEMRGRILTYDGSITTFFANNGGTQAMQDTIRRRESNILAERIYTSATDVVEAVQVDGDTHYRYRRLADGTEEWGPGNAVTDTFIYRHEAGLMRIQNGAQITGGAWDSDHLQFMADGGVHHLWVATGTGDLYFKPWAPPSGNTDGTKLN